MKDIFKMAIFDLRTGGHGLGYILLGAVFFWLLGTLLSPLIACHTMFIPMAFVIPLQKTADKSGFNKLYGSLPVRRTAITRGRFLYIFALHLAAELMCLVLALLAVAADLNRFIPENQSELLSVSREQYSFEKTGLVIFAAGCFFAFFTVLFSYMEMMGQLHGRENEMKILLITLGVGSLLAFAFFWMSDRDIIPTATLDFKATDTVSGAAKADLIMNAVTAVLCLIFSEITTARVSAREL